MRHEFWCLLTTHTPVHLGCGEEYDPTAFVVDEDASILTVVDPARFVGDLDEGNRARFASICAKGTVGSLLEIYRFMRGKTAEGRVVEVCPGFIEHYQEALDTKPEELQNILTRFFINRTAYLPEDGRPYMPGSAVKGALRTAYLNFLAKKRPHIPLDKGKGQAKELEKKLLGGSFDTDPFRLVKVSDFMPVGDIRARILYAVNEKKSPGLTPARGPYQIPEVIQPGARFLGRIVVEEPPGKAPIKNPINLDALLKAASSFYLKEKFREEKELRNVGLSNVPIPPEGAKVLLRIGHHSGAECVTIEGYRSILIRGPSGKGTRSTTSTTLWLASEVRKPRMRESLMPFGWCFLVHADPSLIRNLEAEENAWKNTWYQRLKEKAERRRAALAEAAHKKRLEEQEAERHAREEARRKAEKEARKARLEQMSPEERMIEEVKDPHVTEHRVVEVFNLLDTFPEHLKPDLANALKAYWQRVGKWEKKQCSKKQWQKVTKIKSILSES